MRKTSVTARLKDLVQQASGTENTQGIRYAGKMSQTFIGIDLDSGLLLESKHDSALQKANGRRGRRDPPGPLLPTVAKRKKALYFSRTDWTLQASDGDFNNKVS